MSERDNDDLKRYLAGNDDIGGTYRSLGQEEPPAALDAKILAASRAAVRGTRRPRYLAPLALAASVTLAVGLGWQALLAPQLQQQAISESDWAASELPRPAPPAPDSDLAMAEQAPTLADDGLAPRRQRREETYAAPAPASEAARAAGANQAKAPPAVFAAPPAAPPAPVMTAGSERQASNAETADASDREILEKQLARSSAIALPDAPPPCPIPNISAQSMLDAEDGNELELLPPGTRETASEPAAGEGFASPPPDAADLRREDETRAGTPLLPLPARKLVGIQRLLDAGEEDRARQCFSEFELAHPDYELPDAFPLHRLKD